MLTVTVTRVCLYSQRGALRLSHFLSRAVNVHRGALLLPFLPSFVHLFSFIAYGIL